MNWSRTVVSTPSVWHTPTSEDEIVALVRGAAGQRVRVVGGGHSWSAIAMPEQIAVTLDSYAGIIAREPTRVTVRAGMRLRALNEALAATGQALPIVGSIAEQSIAGAIATGTHGSSLVHGNLASLVERMRVIDGRGRVHDLVEPGPRVHLGALGIVSEVTLRIEPAFRLAETVEGIRIEKLAGALEAIATSAEYCKVWWMPHTPFAHVFRYERTSDEPSRKPDPIKQRWLDEKIMHRWLFPALLQLGHVGRLSLPISRLVAKGFMQPRRVGISTLMLSTPMPLRHRETEAALPMTRAPEAVERLVRMIDRDHLIVNMPVEIRFVRGDDAWMSPAQGADTCQIGAYCYGARATPYFAAFWREMRAINARPHWGKELDHTADEVAALWPMLPAFRALRAELDPDGLFASAFHTRTLAQ